MKKIILSLTVLVAVAFGVYLIAADHVEAPAVTGAGPTSKITDITDVYGFQNPAGNALVLVCNVNGLLSPTATGSAQFDNNVMYEFNIDRTGDNVEDLVIQCLVQNGKLRVYGPAAPGTTGLSSTIISSAASVETDITAYANSANPNIATGSNGIKIFAGPRDDPFFFDLDRFNQIIAGTQTSFRTPGVDFFAGKNVLSIVVEVPKTLFGTVTANTLNIWAESKMK